MIYCNGWGEDVYLNLKDFIEIAHLLRACFARAYFRHFIMYKTKHGLYGSKNQNNIKKTQQNLCWQEWVCMCM